MINLSIAGMNVLINENGAELQSIQYNGLEYLWQANPVYWGKHSPVLFPIVGQLKNGNYHYKGKEYALSRHGFAREHKFALDAISPNEALFTLHNDSDTFKIYPFQFLFQVKYAISASRLNCTFMVTNTMDEVMYFSVGGHPAFNVPLEANLSYTDYSIFFPDDLELHRYLLQEGLISQDTKRIPLNRGNLSLSPQLFYQDAIVLKDLKSRKIRLFSAKGIHGINFEFEGFPFFGIWAAKDAPFICLEPWCGIADNLTHDQNLIHKEGINRLEPSGKWERTWSVEFF